MLLIIVGMGTAGGAAGGRVDNGGCPMTIIRYDLACKIRRLLGMLLIIVGWM